MAKELVSFARVPRKGLKAMPPTTPAGFVVWTLRFKDIVIPLVTTVVASHGWVCAMYEPQSKFVKRGLYADYIGEDKRGYSGEEFIQYLTCA